MIRDTFIEVCEGVDVRQNLSKLRQEIKEAANRTALLYQIGIQYDIFRELLQHEDPKVRKNTALLLGDLSIKELLPDLYTAYESEDKMFVKSSYLTAMTTFDYRDYMPQLKKRLKKLTAEDPSEENKKHVMEEIRALSNLITLMEGVKTHKFTGYQVESDLILLTNRDHIEVTADALPAGSQCKVFNAGVMVRTDKLTEVMELRTYQEMLFAIPGLRTCPQDPADAAKVIAESKLIEFLRERHAGNAPFYFRVELKSKMELNKKSVLAKRLSSEVERQTKRQLINSTSNYEVELRLIENKEGSFNVLVKLYTIEDERFAYRTFVTPTSIKPVNAALMVALTKNYLKEEAKILDPFCGVGTMLIERHKYRKANTMYGIDLSPDAIEKARENTEKAHQIIHYINRDFFDFEHEYLFDEIFTDMPMVTMRKGEDEIQMIYKRFFQKAGRHLTEDGTIIMYSRNREFAQLYCAPNGFQVVKQFEISKREGTDVFVIKRK